VGSPASGGAARWDTGAATSAFAELSVCVEGNAGACGDVGDGPTGGAALANTGGDCGCDGGGGGGGTWLVRGVEPSAGKGGGWLTRAAAGGIGVANASSRAGFGGGIELRLGAIEADREDGGDGEAGAWLTRGAGAAAGCEAAAGA
jgi:hypothetical protein